MREIRCRDLGQRVLVIQQYVIMMKWQEIRINMDTITENTPVDTSLELFGQKFRYPFFAGPVGAVKLHYGDKHTDATYNDILVSACAENGIAAFTGDG